MALAAPSEEWRPVAGSVYEVSSAGRVRNRVTGRYLDGHRPGRTARRIYVALTLGGRRKIRRAIATLVADAFLGPPPPHTQLRFRDGNYDNPSVANLVYRLTASAPRPIPEPGRPWSLTRRGTEPRITIETAFAAPSVVDFQRDCPRCGLRAHREPAFLHCIACGRLFPVHGASLELQTRYEQASGAGAWRG